MIITIFLILFCQAISKENCNISKSIVKIFTQSASYDYSVPWAAPVQQQSTGSGFLIEDSGNRMVVTNAHVVSNATFIQVRKAGDAKKYIAKTMFVSDDTDLAILKILDESFYEDTSSLQIGDTPNVGDEVIAYGYPRGGDELSLTKGIISRVELVIGPHSNVRVLGCDMDAAIDHGSSGGPVVKDDKVVGVSFSGLQGKEGGYIIASEVLHKVIEKSRSNETYIMPELGIKIQKLENDTLRKYLGLDKIKGGVYISEVAALSSVKGILKVGDVILKIDSYDIAENGTIEFRKGNRLDYSYAYKKKFIGDSVRVTVYRDGKKISRDVKLTKSLKDLTYASVREFNKEPVFLIKSGIFFQPINFNLFTDYIFSSFYTVNLFKYLGVFKKEELQDIVLIRSVFQDEATLGYGRLDAVVKSINGLPINKFTDVEKAFDVNVKNHKIELSDGQIIVVKDDEMEEIDRRIAINYGIHRLKSEGDMRQ